MAKKNQRLVVFEKYFNLIERKADLLDRMFDDLDGSLTIGVDSFKEFNKIQRDWDKSEASDFAGLEEPYKEPKETKSR